MIKTKKGLDLPIAGAPEQSIDDSKTVRSVAILGDDYPVMKPTMLVGEGDQVSQGQVLFTCKKTPGVQYTAPVAGRVSAINRGAKRALQSVVIEVGEGDRTEYPSHASDAIPGLLRRQQ